MASDENVGPGSLIAGKYKIVRLVGRGGMGQVFEAHHAGLERSVAIKLLKEKAFADAVATERFLREARISAQLENEHAVRVFDVDRLPSGRPYIVMELLDGADLNQVCRKRTLGVAEAVDYALQATEALAEAHDLGLIHRDLKPHNLFLARDTKGRTIIKVVDFGLAKQVVNPDANDAVTRIGAIVGTPTYMSPEQIRTPEKVDRRVDIWALGASLFAMLAGHPPFVAKELDALIDQILTERAPKLSTIRADVPPEIDEVVARCLENDPAARYADIHALAAALHDAMAALGELAMQATVQDPAPTHTVRMGADPGSLLPPSAPSSDDPSQVIAGRFRIIGRLGSGGMGDVYRAHDTLLDRRVALKILKSSGADAERDRHRVVREARAAASLAHPNAVTIYDVGEDADQVFIAMELVEGESLQSIIQRGQASAADRLRWLREAARALLAAHERGLVHRDVKPENMLVCHDGSLKLLDFGIAKRTQSAEPEVQDETSAMAFGPSSVATEAGRRVGTPRYMAPEQREALPTDARTDQYAWGLVALELFGTKLDARLLAGRSKEVVAEARSRDPALTEGLADAIERTLRLAKEERFPTFAPVIRAIELAQRANRSARSDRRWVLGAIAALALVSSVFAFRAWRKAQATKPPPVPLFVCTAGPIEDETVAANARLGLDMDGKLLRVSGIERSSTVERRVDGGWVSATTQKVEMGFRLQGTHDDAFVMGVLDRGRPGFAVVFTDARARTLHIFAGNDYASVTRYAGNITGIAIVDLTGSPAAMTTAEPSGAELVPTAQGTVMTSTRTGDYGLVDRGAARDPSTAVVNETIALAWVDAEGLEFAFFDSYFARLGPITKLGPAGATAVAFDGTWATIFWVAPENGKPRIWSARVAIGENAKAVLPRVASTDEVAPTGLMAVELANHRTALAWSTLGAKPKLRLSVLDEKTGALLTPTDIAEGSDLSRLQSTRGRTDSPSLMWTASGVVHHTKLACAPKGVEWRP